MSRKTRDFERERRAVVLATAGLTLLAGGCSGSGRADEQDSGVTATEGGIGPTSSGSPTSGSDDADGSGSDGSRFDVGAGIDVGGGDGQPSCTVTDDMNAGGSCEEQAPPDSFEPDVQWSWPGANGETFSVVTPLVANLTDDNGDGQIDLCDVPDIVVVALADFGGGSGGMGHIYVLDGESGTEHFRIETLVDWSVTPALGDIDADGLPELLSSTTTGNVVAFEHDGSPKWTSVESVPQIYLGALALADLDNDGDVEILAGTKIIDHLGQTAMTFPDTLTYPTPTAADLDGDGDLEVVLGHAAYHHDGSEVWSTGLSPGFPQVADLDGDGLPEVLLTNNQGVSLIEHDGSVTYQEQRPTGDPVGASNWLRPATIHDFDGDGQAEYAVSSGNNYTVYETNASIVWSAPVLDASGIAAGTAFDFLGDGVAEAMYGDETNLFIFGDLGNVLLQSPRTSRTGTEYPVVADVDNDGSAEIVVVSNEAIDGSGSTAPAVQVIRDVEDRWIQARRIWNQHTYHVTNVREDGTIPQAEPPSWELLNTFRTNAQIEGGGVCVPPVG